MCVMQSDKHDMTGNLLTLKQWIWKIIQISKTYKELLTNGLTNIAEHLLKIWSQLIK